MSMLRNIKVLMYSALFSITLAILYRIGALRQIFTGSIAMLDFDTYYHIVRDVFAGKSPYELPYMQTLGPPLVIATFMMFAWLPQTMARAVVTLSGVAAGCLSTWILSKKVSSKFRVFYWLLLSIMLFSSFPARLSFGLGQPLFFIVLFVTVALTASSEKWQGIAVACSAIIKTHLCLMILAWAKRSWKTCLWFWAAVGVVVLMLFPVLKPSYYIQYVHKTLAPIMTTQ